jgi:uncharacterized protein (DUF1684 family)
MKNNLLFTLIFVFWINAVWSQQTPASFVQSIEAHRTQYKAHFLTDSRSPLTAADTAQLRFFQPAEMWRVKGRFTRTEDAKPFDLPTYSGITRPYVMYGRVEFVIADTIIRVALYKNLRLTADPKYSDYLFFPFKDLSNGESTYGGGRYIDLKESDIQDGMVTIDFNLAYNPWCAYSDGFNCPIPPLDNHIHLEINAGESLYAGEKKH